MMIWLAILAGFVTFYTFRGELAPAYHRVLAELMPGSVVSAGPGAVVIAATGKRGFEVSARVNGAPMHFRFDTGATMVVLDPASASQAGIDITRLAYDTTVSTAAGRTKAAQVVLKRFEIDDIVETDVPALIARQGDLFQNLLGMSFLSRLASYEVAGTRLTLRGRGPGQDNKR